MTRTRRGNGFGTLVSKGEGKPWLARWGYRGQIYYKSTGETDKKKALKALERITRPYRDAREEDVIRNLQNRLLSLQESRSKTELMTCDIWNEFAKKLKNDDVSQSTTAIYESAVQLMTKWMSAKVKRAKDITPHLAEEYLDHLAECVGAAAYNIRLVLFKRVWKSLSDEFQLCNDAWEKFRKKKMVKSSRKTIDSETLAEVVARAETHDMKLLLTIGIYTGLRISDCATLKWDDIDFKKNIIRVVPIKTKKHMDAPLEIPIHPALLKLLEATPRDGRSEYVSAANARGYTNGHLGGEVVDLFKKCGIETSKKVNGKTKLICGFHSLRHTFVSMAINAGMSPLLVQRIVGHSSVNMTEHYFHDNAAKAAEGICSMPDVLSKAS
ncbi:MAG: site-specific integrase [Kiritimatiellae bacterium]|nr:site-specific integrase [Kiritimatiellia bacterium]